MLDRPVNCGRRKEFPVLRHLVRTFVLAAAVQAAPAAALAQGKLEAHYTVTLASIPIGKGSWTIDIG
jgi:hypothetical protein